MTRVLWEIVLPLFVAFVVGWLVMGWLTWRWRRAGVSQARWDEVTGELAATRSKLREAETRIVMVPVVDPTAGSNGSDDGSDDGSVNGSATSSVNGSANGSATCSADREEQDEPPPADDLKAIRGVGPKMEAKLREMGVTSLRQVAAFTEEDVERISSGIGAFPGRIERDRWVPQARELVTRLGDPIPD